MMRFSRNSRALLKICKGEERAGRQPEHSALGCRRGPVAEAAEAGERPWGLRMLTLPSCPAWPHAQARPAVTPRGRGRVS